MRLDNYLVNEGFFETRNKAQLAIKNKNILVNGVCITKNSYNINSNDVVEVVGETLEFVSKGGLKLKKAIEYFNIDLNNKVMCDIGSSTGGFCDCALKNNIKKIYAVDVGTNQMVSEIKNNDKVLLYENTDFRNIDSSILQDVDIITIDVSFISTKKLLDKINEINNAKEIICLIKPQFESGKEIATKYKGVVLDKNVHFNIINEVINNFKTIDYNIKDITYSPIRGGSGNIEYLAYFVRDNINNDINIEKIINTAFKETSKN